MNKTYVTETIYTYREITQRHKKNHVYCFYFFKTITSLRIFLSRGRFEHITHFGVAASTITTSVQISQIFDQSINCPYWAPAASDLGRIAKHQQIS